MACTIHGFLGLLLRSFGAVGSEIEVTTAQDFERPRLCYTHDASTARSSLVDCAAQNVICVPVISRSMVLGGRGSMLHLYGCGMNATWQAREMCQRRARRVV